MGAFFGKGYLMILLLVHFMLSVGLCECRWSVVHRSLCGRGFTVCTPMDVLMQMCMFMGTALAHVCVRVMIYTPTSSGSNLHTPLHLVPILSFQLLCPSSCCSLLVSPAPNLCSSTPYPLGHRPLLHHCSSVQVCTRVLFLASTASFLLASGLHEHICADRDITFSGLLSPKHTLPLCPGGSLCAWWSKAVQFAYLGRAHYNPRHTVSVILNCITKIWEGCVRPQPGTGSLDACLGLQDIVVSEN